MKPFDIEAWQNERSELNELVMKNANQVIKRFFSLDSQTYRDDVLPAKTKEMLGLVASAVLRCDDCINYHLIQCNEKGVTTEELAEIMSIALVVGGSITIPHIRRAYNTWESLKKENKGE